MIFIVVILAIVVIKWIWVCCATRNQDSIEKEKKRYMNGWTICSPIVISLSNIPMQIYNFFGKYKNILPNMLFSFPDHFHAIPPIQTIPP